ncbi:MAG: alpha/beta hydrolase [Bauldia sp.]
MIGREETVSIAGVPTYVLTVGQGPPLLIAHGGPGFDHGYLLRPMERLSRRRTLIHYDQPGCGRTPGPAGGVTAEATYRHFAALVDSLALPRLGILAHSWGGLVALGAAALGMKRAVFDEGLLVTPVPTRKGPFDQVTLNLFARFPPDVMTRYPQLLEQRAEREAIELVLPYYFANPRPAPDIGLRVNLSTFVGVFPHLGNFDFSGQLGLFKNCGVLLTEHDITTPDLVGDVLAATRQRFDLAGVGHFPGYEDPAGFARILDAAFPDESGSHSST